MGLIGKALERRELIANVCRQESLARILQGQRDPLALALVLFAASACGGDAVASNVTDGGDSGGGSSGDGTADGGAEEIDTAAADKKLAEDSIAREKECGVYTGPSANPVNDTIRDEHDRCFAKCLLSAPCEVLKAIACFEDPDADPDLVNCVTLCPEFPEDGFKCKDGTTIPYSSSCDGSGDCEGEEDEEGCRGHTCKDGQKLTADEVKCDFINDCEDGSDELDCPNVCG